MLEHPEMPLTPGAPPFMELLGKFRGVVPTTEELVEERRTERMREDEPRA